MRSSLIRRRRNSWLYKGKYDINTITSLILDFEMIMEDSKYQDDDVTTLHLIIPCFPSTLLQYTRIPTSFTHLWTLLDPTITHRFAESIL